MFKRLELHNHTNESDGSITCSELIDYMIDDKVDGFAITDHNTISGHRKIKEVLQNNQKIECIYGMEYTTYYGHILCFNLHNYVPWENIDKNNPEKLFKELHKEKALVGIAHPFSYGAPFAQGCRFEMRINDFDSFDFIEIFNNSESLDINKNGLDWWESLVLSGHRIAMTTGMDLHNYSPMAKHFSTYIESDLSKPLNKELESAILECNTYIAKGLLLEACQDYFHGGIRVRIRETNKKGAEISGEKIIVFQTKNEYLIKPFKGQEEMHVTFSELKNDNIVITKLFLNDTKLENLTAIAPVIRL